MGHYRCFEPPLVRPGQAIHRSSRASRPHAGEKPYKARLKSCSNQYTAPRRRFALTCGGLTHSGRQRRAALPESQRGPGVLHRSRRRNRAALVEISARRRGDLGRRREIIDRFRALLRANKARGGLTRPTADKLPWLSWAEGYMEIDQCEAGARLQGLLQDAEARAELCLRLPPQNHNHLCPLEKTCSDRLLSGLQLKP
jgi:hypothetical protein